MQHWALRGMVAKLGKCIVLSMDYPQTTQEHGFLAWELQHAAMQNAQNLQPMCGLLCGKQAKEKIGCCVKKWNATYVQVKEQDAQHAKGKQPGKATNSEANKEVIKHTSNTKHLASAEVAVRGKPTSVKEQSRAPTECE